MPGPRRPKPPKPNRVGGMGAQSQAQTKAVVFLGIIAICAIALVVLTHLFWQFRVRGLIEFASQLQFNNWRTSNMVFYGVYALISVAIAAICVFTAAPSVKGGGDRLYKDRTAPRHTTLLIVFQLLALIVAMLYPIIFYIIGGSATLGLVGFHLMRIGVFCLMLIIIGSWRISTLDN